MSPEDLFDYHLEPSDDENWDHMRKEQAYHKQNPRTKRITIKMRDDLIKMFRGQKGELSVEMIAVAFNLTQKRVIQLQQEYIKTGTIKATDINKHSENYQRRKAIQSQIISNAIRSNPSLPLKAIQKKLEEGGFWISLTSISVTLKRLGFMYRNMPVKMIEIRDQNQIIEERYDFSHWIEAIKNDSLYYTGQCIIQTDTLTRSTENRYQDPDKIDLGTFALAVHLTVGINGLVGWSVRKNSCTAGSLMNHIVQNYLQISDEKDTLLLDNARIHSNKEFQNLVEVKNMKVRFIPLHSPFLNPLESIFNDIKIQLKRLVDAYQVETMDHIHELLDQVLEEYPERNIQKFYSEMREACKRCKRRQKF